MQRLADERPFLDSLRDLGRHGRDPVLGRGREHARRRLAGDAAVERAPRSANLPAWEVVGLEVVEKDLRERRGVHQPDAADAETRAGRYSRSACPDSAFTAVATRARDAATELALATRATKDAALEAMAAALLTDDEPILAANAADVESARAARHARAPARPPAAGPGAAGRDGGRTARGRRRSLTRWVRSSAGPRWPTVCSCGRCGCRSGWSGSSTRPGPTSPPTPPASASRAATRSCSAGPRAPCAPTPPSWSRCDARPSPPACPRTWSRWSPARATTRSRS